MQELKNIIDVNFPISKFWSIMDFSNVPVKLNQQKTEKRKLLNGILTEFLMKLYNLKFTVNSNYPEF